ncbi:MAG: universal stress protein [Deltaproteobacteria bacterium]|nr:universal stress protein [Deltaproteobacteria bacterium]
MERKILVAVDDSENALRAVRFIGEHFSPDHSITLFSVIPDTAAICDMNSPSLTPYFLAQKGAFCTVEEQKKELVSKALEKAKKDLIEAGFEEKKIAIKMETQNKGIARDIIDTARSNYDVVVLGRRGLSGVKEFFLGSVSQKVLHAAQDLSVLLVD